MTDVTVAAQSNGINSENEYVRGGTGLWQVPGVPHKGWMCTHIEDLGDNSANFEICEMCCVQEIRYVTQAEDAALIALMAAKKDLLP